MGSVVPSCRSTTRFSMVHICTPAPPDSCFLRHSICSVVLELLLVVLVELFVEVLGHKSDNFRDLSRQFNYLRKVDVGDDDGVKSAWGVLWCGVRVATRVVLVLA